MCFVLDLVVQVSSGYLANAYRVNDITPKSRPMSQLLPPDLLACEQSLFWLDRAPRRRSNLPFCYLFLNRAKPVCSDVIPATRLHFFIRIGLQLRAAANRCPWRRHTTCAADRRCRPGYATKKPPPRNTSAPDSVPSACRQAVPGLCL